MAIIATEELALRESRLLVPGLAPVGNVVGNTESWGGRASWGYFLRFDRRFQVPILGSDPALAKILTKASPAFGVSNAGAGIKASSSSSLGILTAEWNAFPTSDGAGTGDFSLLVVGAPASSTTAKYMLRQRRTDDTSAGQVYFVANIYYADGSATSTAEAGTIYFGTYIAGPGGRGVRATSRADGNSHCWLGVRRGTTFELWENGRLLGTNGTSTIADIYDGAKSCSIGGHPTTATLAMTDPMHLAVEWDFALPQGACRDLSYNPFQLLKPA